MKTTEFLELYPSACQDGKDYALQYKTMTEVWDNCPRGDWLLWICKKHAPLTQEQSVRLAVAFARRVLQHAPVGEDRPRLAIEAAERWLEEPTGENRAAAYAAARAAADDAARAAAYAARAAYAAAYAAYAAADDAARAARAARAAYAADSADAYSVERQEQADIVRQLIPNPFGAIDAVKQSTTESHE